MKNLVVVRHHPGAWAFAKVQDVGKLTAHDRAAIIRVVSRFCGAWRRGEARAAMVACSRAFERAAGRSRASVRRDIAKVLKGFVSLHVKLVESKPSTWRLLAFRRGVLVQAPASHGLLRADTPGRTLLPIFTNLPLCKTVRGWVIFK